MNGYSKLNLVPLNLSVVGKLSIKIFLKELELELKM